MQNTQCPACGRETAPDATCPVCSHANGAAATPAPPPEVAGWVIERPSPDVLAWAAQTFDLVEYQAALREIEQGGGVQIDDLIAEIERKLDGSAEPPARYRVEYSKAVKSRLRELSVVAIGRGDGPAFLAALKALVERLPVYPQFGDPVIDLTVEEGQIRVGIIRPLSLRYGVYEDRRLVLCGSLPVLLPMARPDAPAEEDAGGTERPTA